MSAPKDALRETVRCGPVRREPDGSWFYHSMFLGSDDDPQRGKGSELKDQVEWVALMLAAALEDACGALEKNGRSEALYAGSLALARFQGWRKTGVW